MIEVTINFGLANSLTKEFPDGTTVKDILTNQSLMATLSYGENVDAKIGGATVDPSHRLSDGEEIDLEVRANTKA